VLGCVVDGEGSGSPGGGVGTRIGAHKARGGGVVVGVVVVDCTLTWSDDEGHKVSGP
jgi:hypothetical protein